MWLASACAGAAPDRPEPVMLPAPRPDGTATSPAESSPFTVTPEGELKTPAEISFQVRPLSGPGSMGPAELAPGSDVALSHVQRYLEAHPDKPLRVECS